MKNRFSLRSALVWIALLALWAAMGCSSPQESYEPASTGGALPLPLWGSGSAPSGPPTPPPLSTGPVPKPPPAAPPPLKAGEWSAPLKMPDPAQVDLLDVVNQARALARLREPDAVWYEAEAPHLRDGWVDLAVQPVFHATVKFFAFSTHPSYPAGGEPSVVEVTVKLVGSWLIASRSTAGPAFAESYKSRGIGATTCAVNVAWRAAGAKGFSENGSASVRTWGYGNEPRVWNFRALGPDYQTKMVDVSFATCGAPSSPGAAGPKATPPASAPATPTTPATPADKPKGNCGCKAGDLLCFLKCNGGAKPKSSTRSLDPKEPGAPHLATRHETGLRKTSRLLSPDPCRKGALLGEGMG
ncbi:MAG: hypothetical protein IPK82_27910 [Polyangiaceae bacterium]|nr:hypothetical protein [Polyangiaceae bacterium]